MPHSETTLRHTFPYSPFSLTATEPFPSGQIVYRPWVYTRLTSASGAALLCISDVDSGADSCVFPASFAIALGLDPLQMKQQMTGGVGNTGNVTYYAQITIELGVQKTDGSWSFDPTLRFEAYSGFTAGLESQGIGLLGESGFFETYIVIFDHKNRLFHIE